MHAHLQFLHAHLQSLHAHLQSLHASLPGEWMTRWRLEECDDPGGRPPQSWVNGPGLKHCRIRLIPSGEERGSAWAKPEPQLLNSLSSDRLNDVEAGAKLSFYMSSHTSSNCQTYIVFQRKYSHRTTELQGMCLQEHGDPFLLAGKCLITELFQSGTCELGVS